MDLDDRRLILELIGACIATHKGFMAVTTTFFEIASAQPDSRQRSKIIDQLSGIRDANATLASRIESALEMLGKEEMDGEKK